LIALEKLKEVQPKDKIIPDRIVQGWDSEDLRIMA